MTCGQLDGLASGTCLAAAVLSDESRQRPGLSRVGLVLLSGGNVDVDSLLP